LYYKLVISIYNAHCITRIYTLEQELYKARTEQQKIYLSISGQPELIETIQYIEIPQYLHFKEDEEQIRQLTETVCFQAKTIYELTTKVNKLEARADVVFPMHFKPDEDTFKHLAQAVSMEPITEEEKFDKLLSDKKILDLYTFQAQLQDLQSKCDNKLEKQEKEHKAMLQEFIDEVNKINLIDFKSLIQTQNTLNLLKEEEMKILQDEIKKKITRKK